MTFGERLTQVRKRKNLSQAEIGKKIGINGNTNEKAQQTLKDAELIKEFQKIEELPQEEKNTILKVISAYIRDFKTKQSYTL